ncbi:unnamed protein product [Gordionus sp. m RMFG-2023]|uniref:dihydrolipoyllysine-residue succinyltransferase component of 2-oxoglutarate dehydrogenase complex, mitochondrial-like n=1 Tax=Gordionus sp. m RMFG-2023 TaxID=3053472 RepID=UPI0030E4E6A0
MPCISSTFHTSHKFNNDETVSSPAFADSVSEGDIRWIKSVGDSINVDDIVCEIETDKTALPIPSPYKGFLKSILVEEGEKVKAHQPVFIISLERPDSQGVKIDEQATRIASDIPESNIKLSDESQDPLKNANHSNDQIISVPQLPESVSEGDIRWIKNVGDQVEVDETLCEIETDKTTVPVPSPNKGVLKEIKVEDGSKVHAKMPLCVIGSEGLGKSTTASDIKSTPKQSPTSTPLNMPDLPKVPRKVSIDIKPSFGETDRTNIPSGVIDKKPEFFPPFFNTSQKASQGKVSPIQKPTDDISPHTISGSRTETKVKMNRMRKRIAERLKQAQNTAAMLTTFNEVDMSQVMALRERHKKTFSELHSGLKPGIASFFVVASARALTKQPIVNAFVMEDNSHISYRDYVDISVAVATPKGLVVPVIRNCENMSVADVEKNVAYLSDKARKGNLAIEDMDGGTFTISNGGVFGSLFGTPIINLPQSAILGLHAITKKPVVINDKIEIRPMMYVALTYDHRLIDGREAVTFLKSIKNYIEDPASILLDI